eukprot:4193137-Amphidinium_carterae.1
MVAQLKENKVRTKKKQTDGGHNRDALLSCYLATAMGRIDGNDVYEGAPGWTRQRSRRHHLKIAKKIVLHTRRRLILANVVAIAVPRELPRDSNIVYVTKIVDICYVCLARRGVGLANITVIKHEIFSELQVGTISTMLNCDRCGAAMQKRKPHLGKGWFMGCTRFPVCKHTVALREVQQVTRRQKET